VRTLLRENSLLTGNNTGNFMKSASRIPSAIRRKRLILDSFRSRQSLLALNRTGNYRRHIRELRVAYQGIKSPLGNVCGRICI